MGRLDVKLQLDALSRLQSGDAIIWPGRGSTFHWARGSEFVPSMVVHRLHSKGLIVWTIGPAGRVYTISEKGRKIG